MATTYVPRYRDITHLPGLAIIWRDDRNGMSAVVVKDHRETLSSPDLTKMFRVARNDAAVNGAQITRRRRFLIHGTHCSVGDSETFRFVQMTPGQVADLIERVKAS